MARIDETFTAQFRAWDERCRGWDVFPFPVSPEPPFQPFIRFLPSNESLDDGRKPTLASSLVQSIARRLTGYSAVELEAEEEPPSPTPLESEPISEIQVSLPKDSEPRREKLEQLLTSLSHCEGPFTFEIQGTAEAVVVRFCVGSPDAPVVKQQLQTFFPDISYIETENGLGSAWDSCGAAETAVVEFGLREPTMRPLAAGKFDFLVGLIGGLSGLEVGELGLFQVIFEPTRANWTESMVRSVSRPDGTPFFVNMPELANEAQNKTSRTIYAAVIRLATRAPEFDRAWEVMRTLAGSLRVFARPNGNELIPLRNDSYPFFEHIEDVLLRQSRRPGMLLNIDELLGFVHFPSSEVRSPKLLRQTTKSKPAPLSATGEHGTLLGFNVHLGKSCEVRLTPEQRVRHTHVIGASGTGKSTLLFNSIRQDIEVGEGVGVIDPHGDLVDQILGIIPQERINDVILIDASDEEYSVGFNILSAHSDLEKTLLASDLVSVFKRLSSAWGDQLGSVLSNSILAFLESSEGGTLSDLRRFLLEPAYREKFLQTVTDPDIVYYWRKGFSQLSGNKSVGPVLTRLETFLSPKPIRYMVSQKSNRLDFGQILNSGKIFLAKLSQGAIGNENAYLLGSLLMAKFQQTAMARQRERQSDRRDFWLYLDEFHNFITPSMAEILSSARKYRIGLSLVHHELAQLQRDRDVASAVMSNCHTRICFRVGDQDARALESGFSYFEARDLQNLSIGETICRVERSDFDFNLSVPRPELPEESELVSRREAVIAASRAKYATRRSEIEVVTSIDCSITRSPSPTKENKETIVPQQPGKVEPLTPCKPPAAPKERTSSDRDPGRGGAQHTTLQARIKRAAQALGYKAEGEHTVLKNRGVDMVLEKAGRSIACEISLTTTIDHEVGNVVKCLKGGYSTIAMVCIEQAHLERIKKAISACLDPTQAAQVSYYLPEGLIEYLRATAAKDPDEPPKEERRLGYKIKRTFPVLSPEEAKSRDAAAIASIAEAMSKKS